MPLRVAQFLMTLPVQLLLAGMILIPSIYVGWLSLQSSSFGREAEFVGLANYLQLLTDRWFWRAFLNTFIVVNIVVYVELGLGLAIALLFAGGVPFRRLMVAIVLMPYAVSEVVAVVMWKYLFESRVGVVNYGLEALGLPQIEWAINPTHALGLVVLISVWQQLPFTFILLYAARLGIPRELYEAAHLDGGTPVRIFWRITVRLMLPAILIALLFRYIFAFRIFSEVWLLTQGGPARMTEVLAVYLYRAAFRYHEFGLASATGWAMVVLSLLISVYYLRQIYKGMFAR